MREEFTTSLPHTFSVHVAISRLRQLLVGNHFVLEGDENLLHGVSVVPALEKGEPILDLARALIDRRHVALRVEFDSRRRVRIVFTAHDGQHVDSVIEVSVGWANDGAVPVGERLIGGYTFIKSRGQHKSQIFSINQVLAARAC